MREILFRGKRIDNGEWVEGDFCRCGVAKIDTHKMGQPWRGYTVHEESISQFTGLRDKNGKRIFEGDIVDHCYQKGFSNRGVVMWDSENARFSHELRSMSPAFSLYNPEAWEVIGNIHDNPELLKEGAK